MQHRRENDCYLVVSSTSVVLFYFLDLTWLQPGPILRLAALWTVLLQSPFVTAQGRLFPLTTMEQRNKKRDYLLMCRLKVLIIGVNV